MPALKKRLEMRIGDGKKLRKKVEDEQTEQAAIRRRVRGKSHKGHERRRDESQGRGV